MPNKPVFSVSPTLALRFNESDKAALVELSQLMGANQTETVKLLVHETLAIFKERGVKPAAAVLKTRDLRQASTSDATTISPAMCRRVEREIKLAKTGDLLARIWLHKNARWVAAHAMRTQKRK